MRDRGETQRDTQNGAELPELENLEIAVGTGKQTQLEGRHT